MSVVVRGSDKGVVVIAGDLFECEADLQDDKLCKSKSEFHQLHATRRDKVLAIADWIVPGHGKMFKVNKRR